MDLYKGCFDCLSNFTNLALQVAFQMAPQDLKWCMAPWLLGRPRQSFCNEDPWPAQFVVYHLQANSVLQNEEEYSAQIPRHFRRDANFRWQPPEASDYTQANKFARDLDMLLPVDLDWAMNFSCNECEDSRPC